MTATVWTPDKGVGPVTNSTEPYASPTPFFNKHNPTLGDSTNEDYQVGGGVMTNRGGPFSTSFQSYAFIIIVIVPR